MHISYTGSGPYCYANSFAMMFGEAAPSTAVIEFATSSPFGMQLIGGKLPFFDPYGWDPELSFEDTLTALGWTSDVVKGGSADEALLRLRTALADGPVWIGRWRWGISDISRECPARSRPTIMWWYSKSIGIGC